MDDGCASDDNGVDGDEGDDCVGDGGCGDVDNDDDADDAGGPLGPSLAIGGPQGRKRQLAQY
eukprot:4509651-Pyramimonas_sp.AAC.1